MKKDEKPADASMSADRNVIAGPVSRRGFVASAGALALAVYATACGDDPIGDAGRGIVRVVINGLDGGEPNAGTAVISGSGIQTIELVIPSVGAGEASVPVGTYHVVYSPPAGYAMAAGEANEFDVTITRDETTIVELDIVEATGTLNLTISGLAAGAVSGGSASVLRTDVSGQTPITVNIPVAGTASTSVVPGSYDVTYTPPTGHQLGTGEPATKSTTVSQGGNANVGFTVTQIAQTGTLRINVVGLLAGAANGGSAQVTRTDIGGQTPFTVNIPVAGTQDAVVPPGTYSVEYFAPSGHSVVEGETNPQEVVVAADAVGSATFEVEEAVTPGGVVFHSDWSTATGTSAAAMLDSSKPVPWDIEIGNGNANEVIPATDLDFPPSMANVLKAAMEGNGNGASTQLVRIDNDGAHIPIPPVGGSVFYRWYIRITHPDGYTVDTNTHPIQDGNAISNCNWWLRIESLTDGTYIGRFNVTNANGFPNSHFTPPALPKGQTFRYEMQVHRIGTNTFNMHARVFDSNNEQVFGDSDFRNQNNSGSLADNPELNFHVLANLTGLNGGHNGLFGSGQAEFFPFVHSYQGGFCVRTDDWCGPYANGI